MVEAPAVAHDGSQLSPILQTATITTCRPGFFKQTTNLIEIFLIFDYLELPAQLLYGVYKDSSTNTFVRVSLARQTNLFCSTLPCIVRLRASDVHSQQGQIRFAVLSIETSPNHGKRRWASRSRCLLV